MNKEALDNITVSLLTSGGVTRWYNEHEVNIITH